MRGLNQTAGPRGVTGKILVLGDAEQVFLDGPSVDPDRFVLVSDLKEGVTVALQGGFQAIGVVLRARQERVAGLLRSLRGDGSAKLIVLARMTEEPLARRLTGQDMEGSGQPAADGYLVYPMVSTRLKEQTERLCGGAPPAHHSETVLDRFEERMRQLERLATEDDLTGLKNRRYIWEFARQILDRARREGGRVTLLVYDIDDFKHYNDVYGHPVGDRVLKEAALLMSRCCRVHDVVGRIGGDEFAVVFWEDASEKKPAPQPDRRSAGATHPREAIFIARRFRKALEESELRLLGPGGKGVLTISGGLASFPSDGSTIDQLFERADAALMEAKRSGKNRIYLVGAPQADIDTFPE